METWKVAHDMLKSKTNTQRPICILKTRVHTLTCIHGCIICIGVKSFRRHTHYAVFVFYIQHFHTSSSQYQIFSRTLKPHELQTHCALFIMGAST